MDRKKRQKLLIEGTSFLRDMSVHIRCPRCGKDQLNRVFPEIDPTSRYANAYICEDCGWDESIRDMHRMDPVPFDKWAICNMNEAETAEYRQKLAEAAADYMVEVGTERTMSGNYHFSFAEIGVMIGVDLSDDPDMIDMISKAAYGQHAEAVCELLTDTDFDFMFYLAYCPNADDD